MGKNRRWCGCRLLGGGSGSAPAVRTMYCARAVEPLLDSKNPIGFPDAPFERAVTARASGLVSNTVSACLGSPLERTEVIFSKRFKALDAQRLPCPQGSKSLRIVWASAADTRSQNNPQSEKSPPSSPVDFPRLTQIVPRHRVPDGELTTSAGAKWIRLSQPAIINHSNRK